MDILLPILEDPETLFLNSPEDALQLIVRARAELAAVQESPRSVFGRRWIQREAQIKESLDAYEAVFLTAIADQEQEQKQKPKLPAERKSGAFRDKAVQSSQKGESSRSQARDELDLSELNLEDGSAQLRSGGSSWKTEEDGEVEAANSSKRKTKREQKTPSGSRRGSAVRRIPTRTKIASLAAPSSSKTPAEKYTKAASPAATPSSKAPAEKYACAVCMDTFSRGLLIGLECGHYYCKEDLTTMFELAIKNEANYPPKCCQPIPVDRAERLLTRQLIADFREKSIEWDSKKPRMYCWNKKCLAFIPTKHVRGREARCLKCGMRTCVKCRNKWHRSDVPCDEDDAFDKTLNMLHKTGTKQCPQCNQGIMRGGGCNHISCPCGYHFCYVCTKPWFGMNSCSCPIYSQLPTLEEQLRPPQGGYDDGDNWNRIPRGDYEHHFQYNDGDIVNQFYWNGRFPRGLPVGHGHQRQNNQQGNANQLPRRPAFADIVGGGAAEHRRNRQPGDQAQLNPEGTRRETPVRNTPIPNPARALNIRAQIIIARDLPSEFDGRAEAMISGYLKLDEIARECRPNHRYQEIDTVGNSRYPCVECRNVRQGLAYCCVLCGVARCPLCHVLHN